MTAGLLTIDALDVHVPVDIWTIDPAHSSIGFSVRHLMGKVRGTFEVFTGHVTTAEGPADCSAAATIAMSSVNTANTIRDDDLRSANFFDVDRHPDMTFEGTVLAVTDGMLEMPGKLTITSRRRPAGPARPPGNPQPTRPPAPPKQPTPPSPGAGGTESKRPASTQRATTAHTGGNEVTKPQVRGWAGGDSNPESED